MLTVMRKTASFLPHRGQLAPSGTCRTSSPLQLLYQISTHERHRRPLAAARAPRHVVVPNMVVIAKSPEEAGRFSAASVASLGIRRGAGTGRIRGPDSDRQVIGERMPLRSMLAFVGWYSGGVCNSGKEMFHPNDELLCRGCKHLAHDVMAASGFGR